MAKLNNLPFIDALRGLAILGVIVFHTALTIEGLPDSISTLTEQGARGVQLFFVISAFTLFLSFNNRKSNEKNLITNYFIRRFFRIAPLFYCAMVFYLLRDGLGPRYWLGDAPRITLENILATATFTNGWNPYWFNSIVPGGWSVAVEMFFYLLVPFIFNKIKSLKSAILLTIFTLFAGTFLKLILSKVVLISSPRLWKDFLYLWFPSELPLFCLGFVLFFLFSNLDRIRAYKTNIFGMRLTPKNIGRVLVLVSISAAIILAYIRIDLTKFVYGLCFLLLALGLALYPSRFIVNNFFCYLGKISYSAYLTHHAIFPFVDWINDSLHLVPTAKFALATLFMLVGTVILSTLTYKLIETPGISLGRHLILKMENR